MNKTCCVTGHRDISGDKQNFVRQPVKNEIRLAILGGYNVFISEFAKGVDLVFAECVAEEKKAPLELFLEMALPYFQAFQSGNEGNV